MNVILAQEEKKKHKPKPKGINDRIDDTDKDNSVIYNKKHFKQQSQDIILKLLEAIHHVTSPHTYTQ